jgi:RNA polymerase sigma factor (sigma-70 family)
MPSDVQATVEAVWRMESAKVVASVTRVVRDVGLAEDVAQDALVQAMEQWATSGVPERPAAWLMTTARRRAIDLVRREVNLSDKLAQVGHIEEIRAGERAEADFTGAEEDLSDDILRLVFTACHPSLTRQSRIALTLRMVGGLTTAEIARAFLTSESTVGQRISRAKRTIRESDIPFEVPSGAELGPRLESVLEVVYLIFNEGYTATSGRDWTRGDLMGDAIRLGRMLAELAPMESEVHGLVALMEIQASRTRARIGRDGEAVLASLERAARLPDPPGRYVLQASIAACHARARRAEDTDWPRIVELYDVLGERQPSPVVALNRAVAVSYAEGPAEALPLVEALLDEPSLSGYHLVASVRGDLLARLGRATDARAEFERAAEMTDNEVERAVMLRRAAEVG